MTGPLGALPRAVVWPLLVVLPLLAIVMLACMSVMHGVPGTAETGQRPSASAPAHVVTAENSPDGSAVTAVATSGAEHHRTASGPCHDASGAAMECASPAVQLPAPQVALASPLRHHLLPPGVLLSWPPAPSLVPGPPAPASTRVILRT